MNKRLIGALALCLVGAIPLSAAEPPRFAQVDPNRQFKIKEWQRAKELEGRAREREGRLRTIERSALRFSESADDAVFLEGTLSLLAGSDSDLNIETPVVVLLQRLAQRRWRAPPMETTDVWWNRLQRELQYGPAGEVAEFGQALATYKESFGEPCLFDWRSQTEFWKDFTQSLIISKADPAEVWRKKIAADEKRAPLYRRAYATAVIAAERELDSALVLPLLEGDTLVPRSDVQRLAEVLRIFALARKSDGVPARLALWGRLQPLLTKKMQREDLQALVWLDRMGGDDQRMLRNTLSREPKVFDRFAAEAKIPGAQRLQVYLAKEIQAVYRDTPLCDVLRELQSVVSLPLWIDSTATRNKTPITLEATGPWLNVLERVLSQTDFRFDALNHDLFWIGTPARKTAARTFWERSLARAAASEGTVVKVLREPTTMQFEGTPLMDVADYLSDLHLMPMRIRPAELAKLPITADFRGVPLHLGLELLADEAKLEWLVFGTLIVFGAPHEIETLRRLETQRVRRRMGLANREGAVSNALTDATVLEFIQTPLSDVCDFLSDLHGLPVAVAPNKAANSLVTINLKNVNLECALDLMVLDSGLTWNTDGEAVYLGSKAEVEGFQELAATRDQKRKSYSKDIAARLRKGINAYLPDQPLSTAAPKLAELIGLPIELHSDDAELGKTSIRAALFRSPADVALDVLCLQHGLTWEATEKGVRLSARPKKGP